jgi:hypothetical protein
VIRDTVPFKYDAIVHLGLNVKSSKLHVELCGYNYCVEGQGKAREDGMEILSSFMNSKGVSRLVQMNPDIEFSRDAGRYYCNEQLYCSLYELMKSDQCIPCLFLHLPPMGDGDEGLDKFTELVKEVIKSTCIL